MRRKRFGDALGRIRIFAFQPRGLLLKFVVSIHTCRGDCRQKRLKVCEERRKLLCFFGAASGLYRLPLPESVIAQRRP